MITRNGLMSLHENSAFLDVFRHIVVRILEQFIIINPDVFVERIELNKPVECSKNAPFANIENLEVPLDTNRARHLVSNKHHLEHASEVNTSHRQHIVQTGGVLIIAKQVKQSSTN